MQPYLSGFSMPPAATIGSPTYAEIDQRRVDKVSDCPSGADQAYLSAFRRVDMFVNNHWFQLSYVYFGRVDSWWPQLRPALSAEDSELVMNEPVSGRIWMADTLHYWQRAPLSASYNHGKYGSAMSSYVGDNGSPAFVRDYGNYTAPLQNVVTGINRLYGDGAVAWAGLQNMPGHLSTGARDTIAMSSASPRPCSIDIFGSDAAP